MSNADPVGAATEADPYPTIRFMLRHGTKVATVLGVVVVLAGLALTVHGWGWAIAGVGGGLVVYYFVRILTELLAIVADTLLPQ